VTTHRAHDCVEVDGVRLAYRAEGREQGESLVFVNSLGTDLRMWDAQAEALGRHFSVIRYDCRGHGESDVSGDATTVDRLGGDLVALLDHLGIARAHLCGLSLGGIVVQWAAIHHPERVGRVVLANTAARLGSRDSWNARIATVREHGMRGVSDAVVGRFLGAEFRAEHPDVARRIAEMVEATPPDGYVAACVALRETDLRDAVRGIGAPTLIIVSEHDESTPAWQGEELHDAIAGSERVMIRGAAHLSNVVRPEEFTHNVARFLGAT